MLLPLITFTSLNSQLYGPSNEIFYKLYSKIKKDTLIRISCFTAFHICPSGHPFSLCTKVDSGYHIRQSLKYHSIPIFCKLLNISCSFFKLVCCVIDNIDIICTIKCYFVLCFTLISMT